MLGKLLICSPPNFITQSRTSPTPSVFVCVKRCNNRSKNMNCGKVPTPTTIATALNAEESASRALSQLWQRFVPYLLEILGKTRGLDHERELLGNGETLVDLKRLWLGGQSLHINNDGGPNKIKVKISLFTERSQ